MHDNMHLSRFCADAVFVHLRYLHLFNIYLIVCKLQLINVIRIRYFCVLCSERHYIKIRMLQMFCSASRNKTQKLSDYLAIIPPYFEKSKIVCSKIFSDVNTQKVLDQYSSSHHNPFVGDKRSYNLPLVSHLIFSGLGMINVFNESTTQKAFLVFNKIVKLDFIAFVGCINLN